MNVDALRGMKWHPSTASSEQNQDEYPGMVRIRGRSTEATRKVATSALSLYLLFFPKALWVEVAADTNRYRLQQLEARALVVQSKQKKKRALDATVHVERLHEIVTRLRRSPQVEPHELLKVVGLLMVNVLCPQVRGIYHHRSLKSTGALPVGAFGQHTSRNRFNEILRNLHFCDNQSRPQVNDKAWKLRKLIQMLQKTFVAAWTPTSEYSFDEGVLPSSSRRNPARMYMPDKPHGWGTKMFMACGTETSYCCRCVNL